MNTERTIGGVEKKKKPNWLLIGIAFAIVAVLIFRFGFGAKGEDAEENSAEIVEKKAAYVETITLGEASSDAAKLERTAVFRSTLAGDVVAENTGRVRQVSFEIGDFVRRGQILAVFDQSSAESTAKPALNSAHLGLQIALDSQEKTKEVAKESLELAKNARKIAKMQYENAKNDPNEDEDIAKRVYENAKDLEDQAEQNVKLQKNQAKLQVNGAQSALDGAKVAFAKTILRAPVSGKVVSKNVSVDDYITTGSRIGSIIGEGKLETVVSLNADQISRIKVNDKVEIKIGKERYDGKIVSLSSIASTTSQRFDVKIETEEKLSSNANKTGRVFLSLALDEDKKENVVQETFFVPMNAVNLGQQRSIVFIMEDEKASIREVQIGEVVGEKIEITTGVSVGEKLIIVNSRNLQDGQSITTKKD